MTYERFAKLKKKKTEKEKKTSDLPDSNQRPKDLSANTTVLRSTNWAKVGLFSDSDNK